jgi:hypothetical protein
LPERPCPLGNAIGQVSLQACKAELSGADFEALVGGAAALAGAADRSW